MASSSDDLRDKVERLEGRMYAVEGALALLYVETIDKPAKRALIARLNSLMVGNPRFTEHTSPAFLEGYRNFAKDFIDRLPPLK